MPQSSASRRRPAASVPPALRGMLAVSIVVTGFLGGMNTGLLRARAFPPQTLAAAQNGLHAGGDGVLVPTTAYQRTLQALRQTYAGPVGSPADRSTRKLTYAAIDGMLASIGDRYTEFWTPDEYSRNMQETSGNFVGIGARLDDTPDKRVMVVEVYDGSPAERAGLLPGDYITAVNNHSVAGRNTEAVIDLIHGPENSFVKLTIGRGTRSILFNLKRSVVHSPIVEWRMADPIRKIGYIQLGMFNENADAQFDAALARLEQQGMKALIFDLRDNPGGLLQVAQDLASRFLPDGPVVWVREKNGRLSSMNVDSDKHRSPLYKGAYPVVVLVNGGSASAAEIVAGAIQDGNAGVLVGTRTYGKGLVQTIMPLADESALKVTSQHYYTRGKSDINIPRDEEGRALSSKGGIAPNVLVDFTERDASLVREQERRDPRNKAAIDRLDPQMAKALEITAAKLAGQ